MSKIRVTSRAEKIFFATQLLVGGQSTPKVKADP